MNETLASATPTRRRSRSRSKGRSIPSTKPIRVWCPGSFDTLHFGQLAFLRKVKQDMLTCFSNVEIVGGLYTDQDLIAAGTPPVFTLDERHEMLRACKWVDEVRKNAPFHISKQVLKETNCDYVFYSAEDNHFYSPKFNEKSTHEKLQECGLLKIIAIPQQEYSGVSSYHIVNRMMLLEKRDENNNTASGRDWAPKKLTFPDSISCKEMIRFATENIPKPTDKVVYIDGAFDILHPGNLALLEKARQLGDFLYVGLHSDDAISKYAGSSFPLMQWNERLMALLSCKYVNEVVIDAPVGVDDSLLDAFSVKYVVPAIDEYGSNASSTDQNQNPKQTKDCYEAANIRDNIIFCELQEPVDVQSLSNLTMKHILNRVHLNWADYANILSKFHSDVETDLGEVNLSQNRDDGDVLKFSSASVN